jgi:hypothetical protein
MEATTGDGRRHLPDRRPRRPVDLRVGGREPGRDRVRGRPRTPADRWQCLGGGQSPWKERSSVAGNGGRRNGLVGGARPWSRPTCRMCASARGRTADSGGAVTNGRAPGGARTAAIALDGPPAEISVAAGRNGRRGTATAMWCGCRRGKTFEGCERAGEEPALVRRPTATSARRRDPGKPGEPQVRNRAANARDPRSEEAVEVVGDHEDGTGCRGVAATARGGGASAPSLEWTTTGRDGGGAESGRIPGEAGGTELAGRPAGFEASRSLPGALSPTRR